MDSDRLRAIFGASPRHRMRRRPKRCRGLSNNVLISRPSHQTKTGHWPVLFGAYPGDIYTPSARVYEPPPEPEYPYHDRTVRVTRCGRICIGKRKINLSTVFAGQIVGIREIEDQIWLVSFLEYDLGYFDNERGRLEPGPNPFVPDKVLTMCPE